MVAWICWSGTGSGRGLSVSLSSPHGGDRSGLHTGMSFHEAPCDIHGLPAHSDGHLRLPFFFPQAETEKRTIVAPESHLRIAGRAQRRKDWVIVSSTSRNCCSSGRLPWTWKPPNGIVVSDSKQTTTPLTHRYSIHALIVHRPLLPAATGYYLRATSR